MFISIIKEKEALTGFLWWFTAIQPKFSKPTADTSLNLNNTPDLLVVDFGQILNVIVFEEHFGFPDCPAVQFETEQQFLARFTIRHHSLLEIES